MECFIGKNDGGKFMLPVATEWTFEYAAEDETDAFTVRLPFDTATTAALSGAGRFWAEEKGKRVFTGVIDEFEAAAKGGECFITVSGRGMAAILMDNEAAARQYSRCGIADILANHVYPFGIDAAASDGMDAINGYAVSSGASEWKALGEFTKWAGDIYPRFDRNGRLVLRRGTDGIIRITEKSGVTGVRYRKKRYGVVSEVTVKGNTNGVKTVVKNDAFIAEGGLCRRIINVPNKTGYDKRRYTGEYVIERSRKDCETLTVTLGTPFAAFAGDGAEVYLDSFGIRGRFFITGAVSWADGKTCGTKLTLIPERGE